MRFLYILDEGRGFPLKADLALEFFKQTRTFAKVTNMCTRYDVQNYSILVSFSHPESSYESYKAYVFPLTCALLFVSVCVHCVCVCFCSRRGKKSELLFWSSLQRINCDRICYKPSHYKHTTCHWRLCDD